MADIEGLANKALKNRERFDKSVGMPLVVIKTIKESGITQKPSEIEKLKVEILRNLRDRAKKSRINAKQDAAAYSPEAIAAAHNQLYERPEDNQ